VNHTQLIPGKQEFYETLRYFQKQIDLHSELPLASSLSLSLSLSLYLSLSLSLSLLTLSLSLSLILCLDGSLEVELRLNEKATVESLKEFDAITFATGVAPRDVPLPISPTSKVQVRQWIPSLLCIASHCPCHHR
jgi:hypothetical protein